MPFEIVFAKDAAKEWEKLDGSIKKQFSGILKRRAEQPRIPSAALSGMADCYKIKLREAGYRLIYQVNDGLIVITVIAVGRRDKSAVYQQAKRLLGL